jgi:DNA-binding response OmpR family regulator
MLPGISGFGVCRELRRPSDDIPIIMLTAGSETVFKIVGLRVGADDYVTKPLDMGELVTWQRCCGGRARFTEPLAAA